MNFSFLSVFVCFPPARMASLCKAGLIFLALAPLDVLNTQFDANRRISARGTMSLSWILHQWVCSCVGRKMSCTGVREIVLNVEDETHLMAILL